MQEYFDREIKSIRRELSYIKTSAQRSAAEARVVDQTLSLSVPLQYIENPSLGEYRASAEKKFEIITDKPALIIPTLSWYFEDLTRPDSWYLTTRLIEMNEVVWPNGNYGVYLHFIGTQEGDDSDVERLIRGEIVTMNVDLNIRSTDTFTIREYSR